MNVFRSLARSLWNAIDFRKRSAEEDPSSGDAPRKERAAARLREGFERAYRSAFSPGARGDGFEVGARGAPVDLTGGVKFKYVFPEEPLAAPPIAQSDFVASLDDLGELMELQAAEQPAPSGFTAQPMDVFEPVDSFEYPAPAPAPAPLAAAALPPAAAELPAALAELPGPEPALAAVAEPLPGEVPAAAPPALPPVEVPVAHPALPSAEAPVPAAAAEPPSAPQYTVALLLPVDRERAVQPGPVAQFSTLELLDTVAHLRTDDEPGENAEAPAPSPEPLPLPGT